MCLLYVRASASASGFCCRIQFRRSDGNEVIPVHCNRADLKVNLIHSRHS